MLDRQGIIMNLKKLRRLYREEKLTMRKRGALKRLWEQDALWLYHHTASSLTRSTPG